MCACFFVFLKLVWLFTAHSAMTKATGKMWAAELRDEKSKAVSQVTEQDYDSWLVRQSLAPLIDPSLIKKAQPCLGPGM